MTLGPFQLFVILCALIGVPVVKILGRLGFSKAFVIVAFIPVLNLIGLWFLAFSNWPARNGSDSRNA